MRRKIWIFMLIVVLGAGSLVGCGQGKTAEEPEILDEEQIESEAQENKTEEASDKEDSSAPEFCGSWLGITATNDGSIFVLAVTLRADGTASYQCGPPESEVMVDYEGTWKMGKAKDVLILDMIDNYDGYALRGEFQWNVKDSSMSLRHLDGDVLVYGTEGATIQFAK